MANLREFANVNDVEVLLYPGNVSIEPVLLFKEGKQLVEMTLSSNIYENELGTFVFHTGLSDKRKSIAETVMNELSSDIENVGELIMFTLKPEYQKKLNAIVQEEEESGRYYDL